MRWGRGGSEARFEGLLNCGVSSPSGRWWREDLNSRMISDQDVRWCDPSPGRAQGAGVLSASRPTQGPAESHDPGWDAVCLRWGLSRAIQSPRVAHDESPVLPLRAGSDDPLVGL